jgi:hypothetical protein
MYHDFLSEATPVNDGTIVHRALNHPHLSVEKQPSSGRGPAQ